VRPAASATWKRLLADAFTVGSALTEPCVFFVLTEKRGQRSKTAEVLFWHEGLTSGRPVSQLIRRLRDHLGYSRETGRAERPRNQVWAFCFSSMNRERARQSDPAFASKTDHQRQADGWNGYLMTLWRFRYALALPQTTWLLCEDGVARNLKATETLQFLDLAKNVLGWKDER
jgi:hypothetical protein